MMYWCMFTIDLSFKYLFWPLFQDKFAAECDVNSDSLQSQTLDTAYYLQADRSVSDEHPDVQSLPETNSIGKNTSDEKRESEVWRLYKLRCIVKLSMYEVILKWQFISVRLWNSELSTFPGFWLFWFIIYDAWSSVDTWRCVWRLYLQAFKPSIF